jgi:hypothetical protein
MQEMDLELVNRFVLEKHHLTKRSKLDNIIQITRDLLGLHTTIATTPYLTLHSRTNNFLKKHLDDEVHTNRNLVKVRFVRKTMHLVLRDMLPIAHAAMKRTLEHDAEQYLDALGIDEKRYMMDTLQIQRLLSHGGKTTTEIKKELGLGVNTSPILNLMCDSGLLIRETTPDSWKSNIHNYYLLNQFLPDITLDGVEEFNAKLAIVSQYLGTFGPVTLNDILWWTGFRKSEVKSMFHIIQDRITQIKITGVNNEYFILNSDLNLLQDFEIEEKDVINILPGLDPYIMGFKDRQRYLDAKNYDYIFDRSGNGTTTILLNGRIIGIWDIEEAPERLMKLYFFDKVNKGILTEIKDKAKALGKFITGKEVKVIKCGKMIPLPERMAGGFMSPLRDYV